MHSEEMERFVRLIASSEHEVYRYIYALVPAPEDAQDVFQETVVALWKNFGQYDSSRPFTPWACRFAYYEVLNFRKRSRHATQWLDDDLIGRLAEDRLAHQSDLDGRRDALPKCLEKLPPKARELLEHRYHQGLSIQEIARRTGRSANTLYKVMERVRHWLADCIERAVAAGGNS